MTHYAEIERKQAALNTEFAREFVTRRWGQELADLIYDKSPKYVRGPKKGQPKGWVKWDKCVKGGWVRTGPSYHGSPTGHVAKPGTSNVFIVYAFGQTEGVPSPEAMNSGLTIEQQAERITRAVERVAAEAKHIERGY